MFSQDAANLDYNFGPGPGFSRYVASMVKQPDGKVIILGDKIYRESKTSGLIRINADGNLDSTFKYNGPENSFAIKCVALQADGKVLIGGEDDYDKIRVMRLNADGSRDASFQIGNGITKGTYVNFIKVQPDGKILATSKGSMFSGSYERLIRLNADGTLDSTFNTGLGFVSDINTVAVQPDGKIIAGGSFTSFNGVPEKAIIRLNTDGSKDNTFVTEFVSAEVFSIVILDDGKLILGGGTFKYQDAAQNQRYLIRLHANGSKDTSFITPADFKIMSYSSVSNICIQPDGKLIASFYYNNGSSSNDDAVYRFNPDGSFDETFQKIPFRDTANILTGNSNADVLSIVLLNNGKILVGGVFIYSSGIIEKGIVCLNDDGTKDSSFNKDTGFDAGVYCSAVQNDGKIIVGGIFDNFKGVKQSKLMRLNADGTKDDSFVLDFDFNNIVESVLLQSDGKIIVKGKFTNYDKKGRDYLLRLNTDGSLDTSFFPISSSSVEAVALQSDGKLIVQMYVSNYPNLDISKTFRLDSNGRSDATFYTGIGKDFDNRVYAITVQPDGKILMGGGFNTFKNKSQNYLVRLNSNGSKDDAFNVGTELNFAQNVSKIVLQPDGKIIIGGLYSPDSGNYESFIIRLNPDGSKDNSFSKVIALDKDRTGYGIGIRSVVLQKDGKIMVGGEFDTIQEINQNRLARLNADGTVDSSFEVGVGFASPVESIALCSDGKLTIGGGFSSYRGISSSSFLIRLKGTYVVPEIDAETIQTNLKCWGVSTGSAAIVSVFNGKSPYTYLWSNGGTTPSIEGLAEGNYTCKITDAQFSTVTKNFFIITDSDFQKPTITAPPSITVNVNTYCTATGINLGSPITSDNCSVVSVSNNAPTSFPIGKTIVTWTVTDGSNNITTATQNIFVIGTEATIKYKNGILTANQTTGTYRWMSCNNGTYTIIPNETNSVFTPKQLGSYAVEVTQNGCAVISACFELKVLGINDFDLENNFKIYPNPASDFVIIETNSGENAKVNIIDASGHVILIKELQTASAKFDISELPAGLYLFQISNDLGSVTKKVIKN